MQVLRASRMQRSMRWRSNASAERGLVLLEVVVALGLFVLCAAIVGSGLDSAMLSLDRLRAEAQATDRLATLLAEVELGVVPATAAAVAPDAEGSEWGQGLEVEPWSGSDDPDDDLGLVRVEAVVRHLPSGNEWRLARIFARGELPTSAPPPVSEEEKARLRELFGAEETSPPSAEDPDDGDDDASDSDDDDGSDSGSSDSDDTDATGDTDTGGDSSDGDRGTDDDSGGADDPDDSSAGDDAGGGDGDEDDDDDEEGRS